MNREDFITHLKDLNIDINDCQLQQFEKYFNMLIEWNKMINLTSITDEGAIYLKHFFDSLTICKIIDFDKQSVCDIGTGAGFPGIPLKIIFPNIKLTLLDSLGKRCNFLKAIVDELNLCNVVVVNDRAEIFTRNNREMFDIVTGRAVTGMSQLLEISGASVKVGGHFIAMKAKAGDEFNNLDNCLKKMNFKEDKRLEFLLPIENSERLLISFKKIGNTNNKFPRAYKEIKKSPL